MLTIRVDCERINARYTNAEYRGKITVCDLTLNAGPYAGRGDGGVVGAGVRSPSTPPPSTSWQIISKSCRFSQETEFAPLILASNSAPTPPPSVKPFNSHLHFQKSAYGPEIISSFQIWT